MPNFMLTAVEPEFKEWTGDHGTFHIYTVEFAGEQGSGKGDLKQKPTSPPPTVGMTLDAEIIQKPGRPAELKRIWKENGAGGSRGGGGKSPTERAEIRRMASQKVAVELLALEVAAGLQFNETVTAGGALKTRIDWLDKDVREAGERA